MPRQQLVSLKYAFVLIAITALCFATYSTCRIYSLIGAALFVIIAFAFLRHVRALCIFGALTFAMIWFATMVDVVSHGPATQHHNQRLARIVRNNELIGEPVNSAVALLGRPTSRFKTQSGETLNYAPFKYFPHGIVQIHCSQGNVSSIELYDD